MGDGSVYQQAVGKDHKRMEWSEDGGNVIPQPVVCTPTSDKIVSVCRHRLHGVDQVCTRLNRPLAEVAAPPIRSAGRRLSLTTR